MTHTPPAAGIMASAWAIFREPYDYPRMRFSSIGRGCFAWALREAWRRARAAAVLAATPTETIIAGIEHIEREIAGLTYAGWGVNATVERDKLRTRLKVLIAERDRRAAPLPLKLAA